MLELETGALKELLDTWPVAHLATVTPTGSPHVVPVVFIRLADTVCMPVDGKRKGRVELARVRNVKARDRASLLLDHYGPDWARLWWLKLDGPVRVECRNSALLQEAGSRLRKKYPQYRQFEIFSGEPTLLVMQWEKVSVWTQSGDVQPILAACGGGKNRLPG